MQNTIWNAVAGSLYEMKRLDVIANNLANADTNGYKADTLSFNAYLAQIQQKRFTGDRRQMHSIQDQMQTHTQFATGALKVTGNQLDVAIAGDGFFTIDTPDGTMYTRAGNFQLDAEGQLVTTEGNIVVGDTGPLQLQDGLAVDLVFDEYGLLYQAGEEIGRLQIAHIENPETLEKAGGKLFRPTQLTRATPMETPDVRQGVVEGSNVNLVHEVVGIVQAGRSFEAYQRVIMLVDQLNQRATQQLGQMPS
ncbi:MAG: flagellar basal-body rod protein FlgF [Candidatus Lernaella stagnicola]|nr:flagellar basal-body rod protein FlgF [Candidatus Lernaella stagnicola]